MSRTSGPRTARHRTLQVGGLLIACIAATIWLATRPEPLTLAEQELVGRWYHSHTMGTPIYVTQGGIQLTSPDAEMISPTLILRRNRTVVETTFGVTNRSVGKWHATDRRLTLEVDRALFNRSLSWKGNFDGLVFKAKSFFGGAKPGSALRHKSFAVMRANGVIALRTEHPQVSFLHEPWPEPVLTRSAHDARLLDQSSIAKEYASFDWPLKRVTPDTKFPSE